MKKKINFTIEITGEFYPGGVVIDGTHHPNGVALQSRSATIKTDAVFMEDDINIGHALMDEVNDAIVAQLREDCIKNKLDATVEYGAMCMHYTQFRSEREVEEEEPED